MKSFLEWLKENHTDPNGREASGWAQHDRDRLEADTAEVVSFYDKKSKKWHAYVVDSNQRRISAVVQGDSKSEAEMYARTRPRRDPGENFNRNGWIV